MWECDVEGLGIAAGRGSNRLFLGVCGFLRQGAQGTPEGGSACMGKVNSRRGFHIGLSVDARRGGGGGVIWGLEERVSIPRRWVNSFGKLTKI